MDASLGRAAESEHCDDHVQETTPMPAQIRLNAAAFISPQNHPILVRNFTLSKQDDLKYHYVAHSSLDVIEERCTSDIPLTLSL